MTHVRNWRDQRRLFSWLERPPGVGCVEHQKIVYQQDLNFLGTFANSSQ